MNDSPRAALLFDATFYGTLAAVRSLGRRGVPVGVVDSVRLAPALWSRYATRRLRCPPIAHTTRFLDWLLKLGEREGDHVLYPTSDELVYVLSAYRAELAKSFTLYQPDLTTILRVLDKKQLLEAASSVGFESPATWFPESARDVERAAREAGGPLMFKPRTQLFRRTHVKGAVAPRATPDLLANYERFSRDSLYERPVAEDLPELTRPMLQRYHSEAAEGIHSVTGFRDKTGRHIALLGAVKVLQRPRKLGIGLCFESAPLSRDLAERVARLLEVLGYHGVFELEFIRVGEQLLLIDMNPRFYHQIALDVARGLDLPALAYAAALEDEAEVARLLANAKAESTTRAFCNGVGLRVLVGAQLLCGTMSWAEASGWRRWARTRRGALVDSAASEDDPAPLVVDVMGQLFDCVRHPRAFVRTIALDR